MVPRSAVLIVASAALSASLATAGERRAAAGFELLPLVAPPAPAAPRVVPVAAAPPRPVCVRRCDGYFFPVAASSGMTAEADELTACRALCPSASVALYFLPGRSDRIETPPTPPGNPILRCLPRSATARRERQHAAAAAAASLRSPTGAIRR